MGAELTQAGTTPLEPPVPPRAPARTLLRLATAGSVDDGKSTLVGRLLHDTKNVLVDQMDAVERVSKERGLTAADLALLTDGLRAEREQGITIDVAYRYFATPERAYVLADCPGHVQYTRNTVTGSSTADVVVLLTDARKGVLEQTRRHLAVAALLRVQHVIVAVNKIDLVDFSQEVFTTIAEQIGQIAAELGVTSVFAIPTSALGGDNIVDRSASTPWYQGPTLLELLETLPVGGDDQTGLRFPVQSVIRPQQASLDGNPDFRGYGGRIAAGEVAVGDEVVVANSGRRTTVAGIQLGERELQGAAAPLSVTIRLADEIDIARGDTIVAAADAPPVVQQFHATVCWLAEQPLVGRTRLLVKHGSATSQAIVTNIVGRLDLDTLAEVPADQLGLNDIGTVEVRLSQPLPVQDYAESRAQGAFLLIDGPSGATRGAGMARFSTDDRDIASGTSPDWNL